MRKKQSGFTLLELLIGIVVIVILCGLIAAAGRRTKSSAIASICMNNLRQISIAMATYLNDNGTYPKGLPQDILKNQLSRYISSDLIFICPVDRMEQTDSYSQFYVYRNDNLSSVNYMLGCPRHRNDQFSVNLFSMTNTQTNAVAKVIIDEVEIKPGASFMGKVTLADGTEVTAGAEVLLIQSFWMEDGRLYTIIRVPAGVSGNVSVDAVPGIQLEIVTPALVAAVRGTSFSLDVGYYKKVPITRVKITDGSVLISPLDGKQMMSNDELVSLGNRPFMMTAGMEKDVFGSAIIVNKTPIEIFLESLSKKIDKGIAHNKNMERDKELFRWISRYVGEDFSGISWFSPAPQKYEDGINEEFELENTGMAAPFMPPGP